jgi:hypothetical protein
MENFTPNQENLVEDLTSRSVYKYCNDEGNPIFKTKEIFKNELKFIFYPYSINSNDGRISQKKIKTIELIGWNELNKIPKDFKTNPKYGFGSQRIKLFMSVIYSKFPLVERIKIGINIQTKFSDRTIAFNWVSLESILKKLEKEKSWYDKNRKLLINNELSSITSKVEKVVKKLYSGELDAFFNKFDSYEKVSKTDVESLAKVLDTIPPSKISTTSNFIKTRDRINKVYLEDIIVEFKKLMSEKLDNEKKWQSFFGKHTWILTHLFPFEVILKGKEAYLGGKTIENEEGRIVDFLFENGFQDNFALLEIKTHKKELLKKSPYRKPDVFAYSDDLSGGINQCIDQKDTFQRDYGQKYQSLDPKTILIIGRKSELNTNQKKCFELIRSNHKNVEIVTFDELLAKLNGLLKVLTI